MAGNTNTKRWDYFQSALQLAIQRSSHKWTYDDFAECFPLWTAEEKEGSQGIYNQISDYVETECTNTLDEMFKEYKVQENINILHRVLAEAKERKFRNETRNDVWRSDLEPHAAIVARTVPRLEEEKRRLQEILAGYEKENQMLDAELKAMLDATDAGDEKARQSLKHLDAMLREWDELPNDDMVEWARKLIEETPPEH